MTATLPAKVDARPITRRLVVIGNGMAGARAVEEILRWDAPVPHSTFRYAVRDVPIAGTVIPAE